MGTRWRETRRMMGASETQEMVVVENDPLRRTVTEAVDGSTRYRTTLLLESMDDASGTLLTVTFEASVTDPGRLQRLALKVVGPLGTKLTEKSLRTELDDIARAAEELARG
ncbi:SRPBCC family protein [Ornithinimicrobium sp. CNJ-824]|uniref:SRPBCC family protein n=1 Tax=Ornithinimicrobium sp. CNJ-824 TaxID=1904966 RepID=UPI0009F9D203|nr:SRPBCC family protein [Ornithinimicrobium sp. CNJ-824]